MLKNIFNLFKKSSENLNVDDLKTSNEITETESFSSEISNFANVKIEIVLTEKEIQSFINQEISNRISNEFKKEFCLSDVDSLFEKAAKIVVECQQGSASLLQRKLKLDYFSAGKMIDQLESAGIVGEFDGEKARTVYVPNLNELELFFKNRGITNDRFKYFKNHILPKYEKLINDRVNEYLKIQEIEKGNELKEILKKEILEKENKKLEEEKIRNLKILLRKELIEEGIITKSNESELNKRELIPREVLDRVWNRDGGKCVKCGSQDKIEFDHIIPFSKGGSNTYRNIQILCEQCNRQKSNNIG